MTRRTTLPRVDGMDPALYNYLDELGKRLTAVADLGTGSTSTQIEDKVNEILAALRAAGKMES